MGEGMKGKIRPEYFVTCGGPCGGERCCSEHNRKRVVAVIRSWGWIKTTSKGWICPACQVKEIR